MSVISAKKKAVAEISQKQRERWQARFLRWQVNIWEIYPILLIATFFRVFGANNVTFGDDEANTWQMARDAVVHHIWPASSTRSWTGILDGVFPTYFYMLAAFFTSNPMWGAIETGLWNVLGVLVTYIFIRRYYGRLAGALSAALYAVTTMIILYNRFIWQPDLVPPMAVALMFVLFWGGVERRKGWLVPAAALISCLYLTHPSSIYMLLIVAVAAFFAGYKTVRWWEIPLAALVVLFIFWPELTWFLYSQFSDLKILEQISRSPSVFSDNVFLYYGQYFSPYVQSPYYWPAAYPTDPNSLLNSTVHGTKYMKMLLLAVHDFLPYIALGGCGILVWQLLLSPSSAANSIKKTARDYLLSIWQWLRAMYDDPKKRGIVLLLVWQVVLPFFLIKYTVWVPLAFHYLMYLMPGPYILVGIGISKVLEFSRTRFPQRDVVVRWLIYIVTALILLGECIGSLGLVMDTYNGRYDSSAFYPIYKTDVPSLRNAIVEADQLAQERHLSRVIISANLGVSSAMRSLVQTVTLHTQVTIFDNYHNCDVLPGVNAGQVVYLVAPYSPVTDTLLQKYANATLAKEPTRTGGDPFKLYIVQSKSAPTTTHYNFSNVITVAPDADHITVPDQQVGNSSVGGDFMVVHAQTTETLQPSWRTNYDYAFDSIDASGNTISTSECVTTNVQAGDQYLPYFSVAGSSTPPTQLTIRSKALTFSPLIIHSGPVAMLTFNQYFSRLQQLALGDGKQKAVLMISGK